MTRTADNRFRSLVAAAVALAALSIFGVPSVDSASRANVDPAVFSAGRGLVNVIVQAWDRSAAHAVTALGGTITRDLPIVDGFSARIPASSIETLARSKIGRAHV